MSVTTHKLRVVEARRIKHPVLPKIEKHYFLVRAKDMANGIRTDANARDPEGLSRRIYRDVQESLMGRGADPGTFDLLNKGIVCLADSVQRLDDHNYRLTKGALYPIFAAFRNKVTEDAKGNAAWIGGFPEVIKLWSQVAPELIRQTRQAIDDIGHKPDQIGKNRGHWNNMHQTVELMILRNELKKRNNGKK